MNRVFRRLSLGASLLALGACACAPAQTYRRPLPPPRESALPAPRVPPPPPPAPAPPAEIARKPLPQEDRIREQDLKSRTPASPSAPRAESAPAPESSVPAAPPLPDDSSLLAKITPGVSPQRAASLRLTDEGAKLLEAGDPAKALSRLERTIVIDSSNPYGYFYLAEVHALRGDNYRALGQTQRAEASYTQALRFNSGNRAATDGLARLQADTQSVTK